MSKPKPLSEREWKAGIRVNYDKKRFRWELSAQDEDDCSINWITGPWVGECSTAMADCEAFLARNGWKNWRWV